LHAARWRILSSGVTSQAERIETDMIKTTADFLADVGSEDDVAYRRSVRNTSVLLGVIVIVVVAGLILPGFFPAGALPTSTVAYSANGLTLNLSVNTTQAFEPSGVRITAWINGTSSIVNVTATDSWAIRSPLLWGSPCQPGFPIGVGVMHGYYDQYNYTSGKLLPLGQKVPVCPFPSGLPQSFLIQPYGSQAIVSINGSLERWNLQTTVVLGRASFLQDLQTGGTFTVIGADEWGDVAILHFVAPLETK